MFSTLSNFSFIILERTIHITYAIIAAKPYPIIDLTKTFSKITVEANADKTKNVVETGTPNLVSKS